MNSHDAISPLDGRYHTKTAALADYFSEAALMHFRAIVEVEYLIALSEERGVSVRAFSSAEKKKLRAMAELSNADVVAIKKIETTTNHDVKALEYFLKEKIAKTSLKKEKEWVHFALTSEDVNSCAHALATMTALRGEILPELKNLHSDITKLAKKHALDPMLARTHGQSASPTTVGKEFSVFAHRLGRQIQQLQTFTMLAKFGGATGNFNAHMAAFPKVNWLTFSAKFVAHLGKTCGVALEHNTHTTQIEPHDTFAELFDTVRRANTILTDFSQDMWRYISDGWIAQKPKKGEVGSSAMPHKVNPIDFENAEGNLGLANALFNHFSTTLPVSRLQRDLSDSTVERNFGVAFGHSLLAYQSLQKGLTKIAVNTKKIARELDAHPEVLAEAIQTVLRREGVDAPYEQLKELTRGKAPTEEDFARFIDGLDVSAATKKELRAFTPGAYIGIAAKLAKQ